MLAPHERIGYRRIARQASVHSEIRARDRRLWALCRALRAASVRIARQVKSWLQKAKIETAIEPAKISETPIKLGALLSTKPIFQNFDMWIVGDTPLITHAWSEKAKREMLSKQVKAPKAGKDARDPQADFVNSLYEMDGDRYGFPGRLYT